MSIEFPMPLSREPPASISRASTKPEQGPGPFERVLRAVGHQVDHGERLIREVVSGRAAPMDAAQLIALQAGIYRYVELVDLSSKFVDRAANAVRTTLQSGG